MNQREFLVLSRNEYTAQRLPCEDIQIECIVNNVKYQYEQKCIMTYNINSILWQLIIANDKTVSCYWIDIINDLFHIVCDENCGDNVTYYSYPIYFDIDIEMINWQDLRYNPLLAMIFARLKYKKIPQAVPPSIRERAEYWKTHYNTYLGKGTVEHYIQANSHYTQEDERYYDANS